MEFREKVLLKDWAWWKIGGPADYFCTPTSVDEVREGIEFAKDKKIPVTILGGGTNVLISDAGVEGLVIAMKQLRAIDSREDNGRLIIEALAGTPKSELTKIFMKRKMAPALFLCGLPGDVGGGVVMNAGVAEQIQPREFVEMTDWVEVLSLDDMKLKRKSKGATGTPTAGSRVLSFEPDLAGRSKSMKTFLARSKTRPRTDCYASRSSFPVVAVRSRTQRVVRPGHLLNKRGLKGTRLGAHKCP
jgi:FAD/FMN-containing dehydrogenase